MSLDLYILYRSHVNKYTAEQLMLMKTQDAGYILQKMQSEKKVGSFVPLVTRIALKNLLIYYFI